MKQKISLNFSVDERNFNSENSCISYTEDFECLDTSFAKKFDHLPKSVINQMWKPFACVHCQKLISDMMDHMEAVHSNPICEYCAAIFGYYNDEEADFENISSTMHMSIRLSCTKTKKLDEKINNLKNEIKMVENNIQNLNGQFIHVQNSLHRLSEECSSLKDTCKQQNATMNKLKSDQDMTKQNLSKIQQQMEDFHYATYDGSLIWKIDSVEKKFQEARSGSIASIYSPIFYSSSYGYNMRARLNLYGDGLARSTHMSIFLVILKGEYDGILTWPFTYLVTFRLFDQSGQNHHIVDSFHPDTKSDSFRRPCSDMNIASGILKFCPIEAIQQENCYVKDDTMFIEIMVDFLGIPRPVLPYTLAINPALPVHEQEVQRRTEVEKYKRIRAELAAELARNEQAVVEHGLLSTTPPVSTRNERQSPSSTTNAESIPCEDILYDQ